MVAVCFVHHGAIFQWRDNLDMKNLNIAAKASFLPLFKERINGAERRN